MGDEKYSVFIAHTEQDKIAAATVKEELEKRGRTCTTPECFMPNMIHMDNSSEAVKKSKCVVLLLSKSFVTQDQIHMVQVTIFFHLLQCG
jgi:hypothetical protein